MAKVAELLKQLQQASAKLAGTVELEATEKILLLELRKLCGADLAILLRPLIPQHWRAEICQPAETFSSTASPIEINWVESTGGGSRIALEKLLKQRQPLHAVDPVRSGEYDFSHLRRVEVELNVQVAACLMLPVINPTGQIEQVVELVRFARIDSNGFSGSEQAAAAILLQQATSNLARLGGRQELSELFESLIQLLGSAIDEKSPYAGDHCRRVPMLTMMLARAVDASKAGAFRAVKFSEAEFYELEVAAWLHDIGKLITPIHVSDKATKLERTFDRFDLVRTRFEILRRDVEIARLRAGERSSEIALGDLPADPGRMLEDLRFLADCNRGRNPLSEDETRRVREIADSYRWIDRQGEEMPVLTEDEAANLMVVRGTLTEEEREMIHNHVVSTINMLDMLPFPPELARVPEIASAHHELYDGKGFPAGLRGDQMSIQSRILGFADIFESVSAGSRPYKQRNSLNQALLILREMVDAGQVDPELFRLFVSEDIYSGYAAEFLSRDQVDPVDTAALLDGL